MSAYMAKLALKISDYGFVVETGSMPREGKSADLLNSEKVGLIYRGGAKGET